MGDTAAEASSKQAKLDQRQERQREKRERMLMQHAEREMLFFLAAEEQHKKETEATTKIQAAMRGRAARATVTAMKEAQQKAEEAERKMKELAEQRIRETKEAEV